MKIVTLLEEQAESAALFHRGWLSVIFSECGMRIHFTVIVLVSDPFYIATVFCFSQMHRCHWSEKRYWRLRRLESAVPAQLALKKMSLRKPTAKSGRVEPPCRERATYLHSKQVAADGKSVPYGSAINCCNCCTIWPVGASPFLLNAIDQLTTRLRAAETNIRRTNVE